MVSRRTNTILLADSYKISHHLQYPPGTTKIFSYFESRGGKWNSTLFFGLQYIMKKHLCGVVITKDMIDEAEILFKQHFGTDAIFNRSGWDHILTHHDGKLPIRIRAVPEGTLVPTKNVLFTVENTDPEVAWLTNYLETILVQTWYPITVATNSWACKQLFIEYLDKSSDSKETLPFMLHDFGFRGVSSLESASIGGAAHLINFQGTDTLAGILLAKDYYNARSMPGFSVPATEHSTMTTWGRENEAESIKSILKKIDGGVSVVVDSYDIWNVLENILGKELKKSIELRDGFLGIRPDSGDPKEIVVAVLDILGDKFGFTLNSKGYKVLPSFLKVIQGDGISFDSLGGILESIINKNWSVENLIFGSGGALLQRLDRDTQKCAYKCSLAVVQGEEREVFKDPITDPGKKSKKGRLVLVKNGNNWETLKECELGDREDQLVTVFENGNIIKDWSWEEIKTRTDASSS